MRKKSRKPKAVQPVLLTSSLPSREVRPMLKCPDCNARLTAVVTLETGKQLVRFVDKLDIVGNYVVEEVYCSGCGKKNIETQIKMTDEDIFSEIHDMMALYDKDEGANIVSRQYEEGE